MKYSTTLLVTLAAIAGMTDGKLKIFNGYDAPQAPPSFAYYFTSSSRCGGVLIHPRFVLTAYHCVQNSMANPESFRIWVGLQKYPGYVSPPVPPVAAEKIIKHPQAVHVDDNNGNILQSFNDIALIKLAQTPSNAPNGLPTPIAYRPSPGTSGYVVGFGRTQSAENPLNLQQLTQSVSDDFTCNRFTQGMQVGGIFCATASRRESATCSGGSGGPFYVGNQVAGVVSFGPNCRDFSAYTDVSQYASWIEQTIQSESQQYQGPNQGPGQFGWWRQSQ